MSHIVLIETHNVISTNAYQGSQITSHEKTGYKIVHLTNFL